MKQEKGLTTANVIVYVIVMIVGVSLLSMITGYFNSVLMKNLRKNIGANQYITFASYFVQDIEEDGNKVLAARKLESTPDNDIYYIQFSNGNIYQYSSKNKIIYRNQVEICRDVDFCQFVYTFDENGKEKVEVNFAAGDFKKMNKNAITFYI